LNLSIKIFNILLIEILNLKTRNTVTAGQAIWPKISAQVCVGAGIVQRISAIHFTI